MPSNDRAATTAPVVIYTRSTCPYCIRAKRLLEMLGARFEEIDINREPARRSEMIGLAGGRSTVPQIFIAGRHIGGCDDLFELEMDGKLKALLAEA
jgi:glutaredoxin 3